MSLTVGHNLFKRFTKNKGCNLCVAPLLFTNLFGLGCTKPVNVQHIFIRERAF